MATNTMVALATYTIPSTQASYTFTGISTAYTDLQLVVNGSLVSSGRIDLLVGNSSVDTTATYSNTELLGNGSTPNSYRNTGTSTMQGIFDAVGTGTGVFQFTANFMSYANTNTYRTILGRYGAAGSGVGAMAGTWRNNTQAINTIQVLPTSSFAAGTTLSLYGIASSDIPAYATGGFVSSDATYWYHAFPMSGTFTPKQALSCDILVVGGGGGGGGYASGGGGGAGGLLSFTSQSLASGTGYTCTVGAGGTAGGAASGTLATIGGNSQFAALTASIGGGRGGQGGTAPGQTNRNGGTGGSGGGGGGDTNPGTAGSNTSGQGNNGAAGTDSSVSYRGGGGGGAGGSGATGATSGNGGIGVNTYASWLSATGYGVSGYIAGGGGGGVQSGNTNGVGGNGGGGNGGNTSSGIPATAGINNTGSGGGGSDYSVTNIGGTGGSGLIIVRYAK